MEYHCEVIAVALQNLVMDLQSWMTGSTILWYIRNIDALQAFEMLHFDALPLSIFSPNPSTTYVVYLKNKK